MHEQVRIYGSEEGGIYIYDKEGREIVMWHCDEFAEDPTVALCALDCLKMFYEQGEDAVKASLGWVSEFERETPPHINSQSQTTTN